MPRDRLRIDVGLLQELVRRRSLDVDFHRRTESEIRAEYIDRLFVALGWDVYNQEGDDLDEWRREESGIEGRLDYTVYTQGRPTIVIEAKRAGRVTGLIERGLSGSVMVSGTSPALQGAFEPKKTSEIGRRRAKKTPAREGRLEPVAIARCSYWAAGLAAGEMREEP